MSPTLAIDFGTSNSAAAMIDNGELRRIPISAHGDTLPTAVFFPEDRGPMMIGEEAVAALIARDEGRFMRALKSILGTALFHESRLIAGKRRTMAQIVTQFLIAVKTNAEQTTGHRFSAVLSGRPVHFHSADPTRDQKAQEDLRHCYHQAGFERVDFLYEPEAAALASHAPGQGGQLGLIVDIGGGTSDFTLFRSRGDRVDILSSHGIRLGGTDFDHAISLSHVMPLLGQGGELRRSMGQGLLPVPNALYSELANWAKIPFLYTRDTLRKIEDMQRHAVEPDKIGRLHHVIEEELGHQLAFAVEKGKIAANGPAQEAAIRLDFIQRNLDAAITARSMDAALADFRARLGQAIEDTLTAAGIRPDQIDAAVLVGGSSLMNMVAEEVQDRCPAAQLRYSDAFTAVVDGLALATQGRS